MTESGAKVRDTREEDASSWRVVGITDDEVSLSGPGPCRGLKTVERTEFDTWWEEV